MENKVIAKEYVDKNYIKKSELNEFIESELQVIERMRNKKVATVGQIRLDGMRAVYKGIKNQFLEDK